MAIHGVDINEVFHLMKVLVTPELRKDKGNIMYFYST